MTRGEIDNTEAAHAQADLALHVETVIVRPAMRHDVAHAVQNRGISGRVAPKFQYSSDSTHRLAATPLLRIQERRTRAGLPKGSGPQYRPRRMFGEPRPDCAIRSARFYDGG